MTRDLILSLLLLLAFGPRVLAEAHYVFHERTTKDITAGASNTCPGAQPYVDTLTPGADLHSIRFGVEYRFSTDRARVYYTTDGSNPSGAFGIGSNTTQVIVASYACRFTTATGVVEVCLAALPPQPVGTAVKYIVSAWHSSGGEEVFGNSGVCPGCPNFTNSSQATVFQYTITAAPTISSQPQSRTNVAGTDASFSVVATGAMPLGYQWYFNATNALGGATNSTLTLTNVQAPHAGNYSVIVTNVGGAATSAVATLTVRLPPFISQEPLSLVVTQGNTATFSVVAGGDPPLNYQWRRNGTAISGATNSSHTITNVQTSQAGNYDVFVTNAFGSTTSQVAVLEVLVPPFITAQPVSLTVTQGQTAQFNVAAGGSEPLSYQWRFEDADLSGQTNSSLMISNAQPAQAGSYTVRVANRAGEVLSASAALTVLRPPLITVQPMSRTNVVGSSASFSVNAVGTAPLSYQWYFERTNALSGGSAATVNLFNVQTNHAGAYSVVVANSIGAVTSAVATLTVSVPPFITQQPTSLTVTQGSQAIFFVIAGGDAPLSYRWRLNGTNVPGATNVTHTISSAQAVHSGNYDVVVSNNAGSMTSVVASLTVLLPPTITAQPVSLIVTQGQNAVFTVSVTGNAPLAYGWSFNETPVPGVTNSLVISNAQPAHAGSYRVVVSNYLGSVTSSVATLTVRGLDFGDAPEPGYATLLASNGARHVIVPGLYLGAGVDFEPDGQPNATATGDDLNGSDEDGVNFGGPLFAGQTANVTVLASTNGILNAWFDFNRNGSWSDPGDQIVTNRLLAAGTNLVSFLVRTNAAMGDTFARFRFSSVGGLSFAGGTPDGEVEDYAVSVLAPVDLALTMIDAPDPVNLGSNLTYTISITNRGSGAAAGVIITDPLPGKVSFLSVASSQGACTNVDGTVTCVLGSLAAGARATVTIVTRTTVPGTVTNTASATAAEFDANPANNIAAQTTAIISVVPTLTNPDFIDISHPDEVLGPANPYPSSILVSGLTAMVYKVTATLNNLNHSFPDDVDILLVGPGGRSVILMSDAGSSLAAVDLTLTFDDNATQFLSNTNQLVSGTFKPSNYGSFADTFPAPAPPGPYGSTMSVFNGINPNGTWSLYVFDDLSENVGYIDGWSLNITTLEPISDLALTMTDAPDPTAVGTNLTYTITVTNRGPASALNTIVTDRLPAGLDLVSMSASQGSCSNQSGLVSCGLGNLASGSGAIIRIVVMPTVGGTFTNTVTAASDHVDLNLTNNTAVATTSVAPVTDLSVAKMGAPEPVFVGQDLTYTLNVTNLGPNIATGVNLSDTLPPGLSLISASASQGSCTNLSGTIVCALGNIASSGRAAVSIVCRPGMAETVTNFVTVLGDQFDNRPANNSAAAVTTVLPVADLVLTMNDSPDPVGLDRQLTYTMVISNRGPSTATGLTLVNPLPPNTTFVSVQAMAGNCTNAGGTVTCNLTPLASSELNIVTLTVAPTVLGFVTNTATLTSATFDPTPTNNIATNVTTVRPVADLALHISGSPNPVWVGDNLAYTISITNRGPAPATAVTLTNTLPANATFVSAASTQGACVNQSGTVACDLGNMATGSVVVVTIMVSPNAAGHIANTVAVASNEIDSDPANNLAVEATEVITAAGVFANFEPIDLLEAGPAAPYPSVIFVSGLTAAVHHVRVTLHNLSHSFPDDLDILLAGPDGKAVLLMSDAGGGHVLSDVRLAFDDAAPFFLPDADQIVSGSYKPTNYAPSDDSFPEPAPPNGYRATLGVFEGMDPNGPWSLYILDDDAKDGAGLLAGGWTIELAIRSVLGPPQISDVPDQIIDEDTATDLIAFTVSDPDSAAETLLLIGRSSNPALVSDADIDFGGSGSNRTVRVTPSTNQFGTAIITIIASDPGGASATNSFTLIVNPLNEVPTLAPIDPVVLAEDQAPLTVLLSGISSGAPDELQRLRVTAISSHPAIVPNPVVTYTSPESTGSLTLMPLPNANGSAIITVTVDDGQTRNYAFSRSFTVTIIPTNDPPTISSLSDQAADEDIPIALPITVGDAETALDLLTISASSSNPTLVPDGNIVPGGAGANRTLTITSATNQSGTATIMVTVTDMNGASASDTFLLTIRPQNDAPTLSAIADRVIVENAGPQTNLLTGIGTGAADENDTLTIVATSSNPALIPDPTVHYANSSDTALLTFSPATNASGTAIITVTIDDGQGENQSFSRTFKVTVNSRNDAPTISEIAAASTLEDVPIRIPFTINDTETPPFQLKMTGTSLNTNLVANTNILFEGNDRNRFVIVRPNAEQSGSATIRLTVSDGSTNASTTFTLTVVATNDPPTLNPIADISIPQSGGGQINVPFTGVTSGATNENQFLQVTAVSSNVALITVQTVNYNSPGTSGSLRLRPGSGTGTAVIAVTVNDLGTNGTFTRTFTVFVRPGANTVPVISDIADQTTGEDTATAAIPFTVSDTQTPAAALTLTGRSSNPTLVPEGNIRFGGDGTNHTVVITPAANQFGTTTITISVQDTNFGMSSDTFLLTVNPTNDTPAISSIADQTIDEDTSTPIIPFTVQDVETPTDRLTLTGHSSNLALVPATNIVFGGNGTNRSLVVIPAPNQTGTSVITVAVSDGLTNRSASFVLTVNSLSDPPSISSFANQTTDEDTPTGAIQFTIGDAESPATDLRLFGRSSNPMLVPNENIIFSGGGSNWSVVITPAANEIGGAFITIAVQDAASNNVSTGFLLNVHPVNDPPTLDSISNLLLNENAAVQTVPLTGLGSGAANEMQTLAVSASSSDTSLVPPPTLNYASPDSTGTLTFMPVPGVHGTATITVTVNDGQNQNNLFSRAFDVVINATPTLSSIPDQTIPENGSISVPFILHDLETAPENLNLTGSSSNLLVIPDANILFAGTGTNRNVILTPSANRVGKTLITITATDPNGASHSESFEVSVVESAPVIITQPSSQGVELGRDAIFQVGAAGSAPLSYQWRLNGIDLPGEINAVLRVIAAQPADAGDYTVTITNQFGGVTSATAQLRVLVAPQITLIVHGGTKIQISFTTAPGQAYILEFKDSLEALEWTLLNTMTGTGDIMTVDDTAPGPFNRFYRVRSP